MAAVTVNVGHVVNMTMVELDQNGNPMLTPTVADSAPVWTNAPSAVGVDTLAAAPGGLTAVASALAVGTDVVTLTAIFGGVTMTATQPITIDAAPQVLTSVSIASTVV